jgi:hypothetical protein
MKEMITIRIGQNAGILWLIIRQTETITVSELKEYSGLNERDFFMALGWLASEGNLFFFDVEQDNWKIKIID